MAIPASQLASHVVAHRCSSAAGNSRRMRSGNEVGSVGAHAARLELAMLVLSLKRPELVRL